MKGNLIYEQAFKSILPTQGRSCYFPPPLGIGLSLPLVGKQSYPLDVKGHA